MQAEEPLVAGNVVENKLLNGNGNGGIRYPKEGSNTSMHEFRRSRSSPRGKFFM